MILALRRLGWKASDAFRWATDQGRILDVRKVAPSAILKVVRSSIGRMLWREWAVAPSATGDPTQRDSDGYWTHELRKWTLGPSRIGPPSKRHAFEVL